MSTTADQTTPAGHDEYRSLQAEIARLRAERDSLATQLDKAKKASARPPEVSRHRIRGWVAAVLVVLTAVLIPVSATLLWAHRTALNTNRYVATVGPLGSDPVVTTALARQVSAQIYDALDPQPAIAAALPPKASFLAGPIASGLETVVFNATKRVMTSDQFAQFWTNANKFAHQQIVAVLRGKSTSVTTQGDMVVLNLVPVLNAVIRDLSPTISGIVGKSVNLPSISGNELPSAVCAKISSALGRPLPATCGQVPLFPASKLDVARQAVTRFDRVTVLTLVLAPLLFVLALFVSPRRRRTLLQLLIGSALGVVVFRRLAFYLEARLTSAAKPENRDAVHAIVSQLLGRFALVSAWMLGIALAAALVTTLTGPYRWARRTRHGVKVAAIAVSAGTVHVASALSGRAREEGTRRWVAEHRALLQAGGGVVFVLLLLMFSVPPVWVLALAVVLALYELAVVRLAHGAGVEPDQPTPKPPREPSAPAPRSSAPTVSG